MYFYFLFSSKIFGGTEIDVNNDQMQNMFFSDT